MGRNVSGRSGPISGRDMVRTASTGRVTISGS